MNENYPGFASLTSDILVPAVSSELKCRLRTEGLIDGVEKHGESGRVFDYVRVTVYNSVLLHGKLYSREGIILVGKLVSKP
jgi:hypothetical protein